MSYTDSVRFLYSLGNELRVGAKWGLERMQILLAALGNPERGKRFVHVAGTNGKGSTCAMIAAALTRTGFRTGLYTSPHLLEPTERIQIDGVPISTEEFSSAFNVVHTTAEQLIAEDRLEAHPSYFETVTAMALLVLSRFCDISVIEVGLGGRLDATNVISPELTVITPISFDHEAFLGSSLTAIAAEKAGILKPERPLVLARQAPEVETLIREKAAVLRVPITSTSDLEILNPEFTARGCKFAIEGKTFECYLPGRHQLENAKAAFLGCKQIGVQPNAMAEGLRSARWPGRLEYICEKPDFILDGAHNPAGAAALGEYIREFSEGRPIWIVYGAMRDKAIEEVTAQLFPLANRLILTAPNFPRALRPETLANATEEVDCVIAPTVEEAILLAHTAPRDAMVFFTGSLYLVGEARALLLAEKHATS